MSRPAWNWFMTAATVVAGCGGTDDSGLRGGAPSPGGAGGQSTEGASGSGDVGGGGAPGGGTDGRGGRPPVGGTSGGGAGSSAPTPCDSDNDCTPTGQLCDFARQVCAACIDDSTCDSGFSCRDGLCVRVYACADSRDCLSAPDGKTICDQTISECVQCVAPADCEGTADCIASRCVRYTDCVNSLDCPLGEVCDSSSARCVGCLTNADCSPSQACVYQTCQATTCAPSPCGTRCGTVPDGCGGTLSCGSCDANCDAPQALHQIRFVEAFGGTNDYFVLRNRSTTCTLDVARLGFYSVNNVFNLIAQPFVFAFPSYPLGPGQEVYVVEEAGALPGDIAVPLYAASYEGGTLSEMRICAGACVGDGTDDVIDMLVSTGQTTPAPFMYPLPPLSSAAATSYVRVAFDGAMPEFFPADWAEGPATRPDPPAMP